MALSNVVGTQFDSGTVTISDGTGAPLTSVLRFDNADLSASGISETLRGEAAYQTRGVVHSLRSTAREFPTGSASIQLTEFSETATGTALDLLHATAGTPYAARISTTVAKGDLLTFDIIWAIEGTDYNGNDHTITFEDCRIKWDVAHGDPNSVTFSWTCYGDITGDLSILVD